MVLPHPSFLTNPVFLCRSAKKVGGKKGSRLFKREQGRGCVTSKIKAGIRQKVRGREGGRIIPSRNIYIIVVSKAREKPVYTFLWGRGRF